MRIKIDIKIIKETLDVDNRLISANSMRMENYCLIIK